ncbi:ABC transporter permease [Nakamurella sp. YIM 132087]|uniref:ABC transporter permease n=1 Tax=Nakamurella alba TaxID=2665158 RepID=A0A7K1FI68_9ACTN|nr:ABC transporter permease [Nakamurella alba]MTD13766.1 ABC transporter permease [Nakamurella alba]
MTAPVPGATFAPGTFLPRPEPAPAGRAVLAAARFELTLLLRNGEQLLLAVVIPLAVLLGLTLTTFVDLDGRRIDVVTPGVLVLAVMSTAFTSQAITTGFDRRYGVLKRLAAAGVGRLQLVGAKCLATLGVLVLQMILLGGVALALGWQPHGNAAWAVLLVVLGAAAFVALALLVGGTLRAEAVLALANLVWLVLIGLGGVVIPLSDAPSALRTIGELTPTGALTTGLRAVLTDGTGPGLLPPVVLLAWVLIGTVGTVRWFRWH